MHTKLSWGYIGYASIPFVPIFNFHRLITENQRQITSDCEMAGSFKRVREHRKDWLNK